MPLGSIAKINTEGMGIFLGAAGISDMLSSRKIKGIQRLFNFPRLHHSTRKKRSLMAGQDKDIRINQGNRVEWCPELAEGLSVFKSYPFATLSHGSPCIHPAMC